MSNDPNIPFEATTVYHNSTTFYFGSNFNLNGEPRVDVARALIRIARLTSVSAKVHFLSCEPLLGPIYLDLENPRNCIEWVIAGGESGSNFREMKLEWAKSIRDQCLEAKVPFWFKQSSGPRSEMNPVLDGREWREMPSLGGAKVRIW